MNRPELQVPVVAHVLLALTVQKVRVRPSLVRRATTATSLDYRRSQAHVTQGTTVRDMATPMLERKNVLWVTTVLREVRSPRDVQRDHQATAWGIKASQIASSVQQGRTARQRPGVRAMFKRVKVVWEVSFPVLRATIVQQEVTEAPTHQEFALEATTASRVVPRLIRAHNGHTRTSTVRRRANSATRVHSVLVWISSMLAWARENSATGQTAEHFCVRLEATVMLICPFRIRANLASTILAMVQPTCLTVWSAREVFIATPPTLHHQAARAVQDSIVSLEPSGKTLQKPSAPRDMRAPRARRGRLSVGQEPTRGRLALLPARLCAQDSTRQSWDWCLLA